MKNIIIILFILLIADAAYAQVLSSSGFKEKTGTFVVENTKYFSGKAEVAGIISKQIKSDCFETIRDLYIARDENIQVESGHSKIYVAGNSIVFGPGFIAKEGSYMHAYISPNFCPDLPESFTAQNANPGKMHDDKTSGINEFQSIFKDRDVSIYPNPTKGKICIDFMNQPYKDAEIFILDSKGQKIQNLNTQNKEKIDMDLTSLSNGIYLVVVRDADKVITGKIVKNKD